MKIDLLNEIRRRQDDVKRLRAELDQLCATARILGVDVDAAPADKPQTDAPRAEASKSRGRQAGSISSVWRSTLRALWSSGGPFNYADVHAAAELNGIEATISSVRDRVRNFVAAGFVSGSPETGFNVTEIAAERFGFRKTDRASVFAEALDNPAPEADQTDADETSGKGGDIFG